MTTFTVTDCSTDSQLQDAISHATDGDTITLSSTLTIKRKGQTAGNLTLDGSGESVILDGGVNFEISWEEFRSLRGRFGLFHVPIQCGA